MVKLILLFVVFLNFISSILVVSREENSWNNRLFCVASFLTSIWTFANYMSGVWSTPLALEATYAGSVLLMAAGLFWVLHAARRPLSRTASVAFLAVTLALAFASFVPSFIGSSYTGIYIGGVFTGVAGYGLPIYFIYMAAVFLYMLAALLYAWIGEREGKRALHLRYLFFGIFLMLALIIFTDIVLPHFYIFKLTALPSVSFPLFLVCVGYAVVRDGAVNVKIVATELAILSLWAFMLIHVFALSTLGDQLLGALLFIVTVFVGWQLRASVITEVRQKEKLEKAAEALRDANAEIALANRQLSELSELKTEFLSFATHQLRSPLAAISGYAAMLYDGSGGKVTARGREIAGNIGEAAGHLSHTVEDFLNVAKIEQGGMVYEKESFDLADVVKDGVREIELASRTKGLELVFESDGEISVFGDREKIRQVVGNILDNAVKYTKAGSVRISVTDADGHAALTVSDTGIGIAENEYENIFEKFKRSAHGMKAAGGSGLGLYLARQIVEGHGGTVRAESEGKERGATFIVRLPRA